MPECKKCKQKYSNTQKECPFCKWESIMGTGLTKIDDWDAMNSWNSNSFEDFD